MRANGDLMLYGSGALAAKAAAEALAAIASSSRLVVLDASDPFLALPTEAPCLVLVELEADSTLSLALCRVVRVRFPWVPIVAVYGADRAAATLALREAAIDAIFPADLENSALAALLARQLRAAEARSERAVPPPPVPVVETPKCGTNTEGESSAASVDALRLFVRHLAHEVNNPLTTIRGLLQLLQSGSGRLSASELTGALETMDSESRRIGDIVAELEYFGGSRRPVRTAVDIGVVIREALDSLELRGVEPKPRSPLPEILVDREQMFIAFRHLFGYLAAAQNGAPSQFEIEIGTTPGRLDVSTVARVDRRALATLDPLVPLYASRTIGTERRSLACALGIARAHGGDLTVEPRGDQRIRLLLAVPAPAAPVPD